MFASPSKDNPNSFRLGFQLRPEVRKKLQFQPKHFYTNNDVERYFITCPLYIVTNDFLSFSFLTDGVQYVTFVAYRTLKTLMQPDTALNK